MEQDLCTKEMYMVENEIILQRAMQRETRSQALLRIKHFTNNKIKLERITCIYKIFYYIIRIIIIFSKIYTEREFFKIDIKF